MTYINFEDLPKELKGIVEDFAEMPNKISISTGEYFAIEYAKYLPEVFDEILTEEIDFDDLPTEVGQWLYKGGCSHVVAGMVRGSINNYFYNELKTLVEEYNYDEESDFERRQDFEACEVRDLNSQF